MLPSDLKQYSSFPCGLLCNCYFHVVRRRIEQLEFNVRDKESDNFEINSQVVNKLQINAVCTQHVLPFLKYEGQPWLLVHPWHDLGLVPRRQLQHHPAESPP